MRNIGLRPARAADLLSAYRFNLESFWGWAHRVKVALLKSQTSPPSPRSRGTTARQIESAVRRDLFVDLGQ